MIGTSAESLAPETPLVVRGVNASGITMTLYDSTAMAQDVGGAIAFGRQNGVSSHRWFANMKGGKENSASGNYAGYLSYFTRPNGGSLAERMRIDSSGNVGIGTTTPSSKLEVVGPIETAFASKTADYTVTASDSIVVGNPSTANITFTLPTASGIAGRRYTFKNISSTYSVIIDGSGTETIDGATTKTLGSQYAVIVIFSDGTNWLIESQLGTIT